MNDQGTAKQTKPAAEIRVNEKKWSKTLMDAGWTAVPNIISTYWWTHDNMPHPSKKTIADALNVKPRTVQRRIAELQAGGLIRREERRIAGKGSRTNLYHFDGLIKAALPYAKEKLQEIAARAKAKKSAAARKGKAKLELVKSADERNE